MNREIKFRGKRIDNSQWAYGDLVQAADTAFIRFYDSDGESHMVSVDPKTVGQYIGAKDKNEKDVYEGDLCVDPQFSEKHVIKYCFQIISIDASQQTYVGFYLPYGYEPRELTVVGNIHDNSETVEAA